MGKGPGRPLRPAPRTRAGGQQPSLGRELFTNEELQPLTWDAFLLGWAPGGSEPSTTLQEPPSFRSCHPGDACPPRVHVPSRGDPRSGAHTDTRAHVLPPTVVSAHQPRDTQPPQMNTRTSPGLGIATSGKVVCKRGSSRRCLSLGHLFGDVLPPRGLGRRRVSEMKKKGFF